MSVLFLILPLALLVVAAAVAAFVWAARSGQLDDLDTPPIRLLGDDQEPSARDQQLPSRVPPENSQ
jgi:cbb3-type cytochrome oxidase maturation protein